MVSSSAFKSVFFLAVVCLQGGSGMDCRERVPFQYHDWPEFLHKSNITREPGPNNTTSLLIRMPLLNEYLQEEFKRCYDGSNQKPFAPFGVQLLLTLEGLEGAEGILKSSWIFCYYKRRELLAIPLQFCRQMESGRYWTNQSVQFVLPTCGAVNITLQGILTRGDNHQHSIGMGSRNFEACSGGGDSGQSQALKFLIPVAGGSLTLIGLLVALYMYHVYRVKCKAAKDAQDNDAGEGEAGEPMVTSEL